MADFAGKVAFVSGGSRGIGRACCLELAKRGAAVAFSYQQSAAGAEETLAAIAAAGGRGKALQLDVADAAACARAIEETVAAFGRLDALVNNAGIHVDALALRVKPEDWDRQFAVNVGGAFQLARSASKVMMRQEGGGAIVFVSSIVGEMGNPGQSVYAATKAALVGLTKSLARELAGRTIRVNAVSPGFIETDMVASMPLAAREKWVGMVPLARLGRPDEVARAVVFLASEDASYITGEVVRVNGGLLT